MFSFIVVFRSQDAPIDQPAIAIGWYSVICDWLGVKMTNDCWRQYLNHKHELPVWYQLISWLDDWLVGPAMSAPADTSSHDHDCGRVRSIPPFEDCSRSNLFWASPACYKDFYDLRLFFKKEMCWLFFWQPTVDMFPWMRFHLLPVCYNTW